MRLINRNDYCRVNGCAPPYGNNGECVNCIICDCPIIEAEPVRHGRWNFTSCSLCGKSFLDYAEADCDRSIYLDLPNYCPSCGAKMDGEEDPKQ